MRERISEDSDDRDEEKKSEWQTESHQRPKIPLEQIMILLHINTVTFMASQIVKVVNLAPWIPSGERCKAARLPVRSDYTSA